VIVSRISWYVSSRTLAAVEGETRQEKRSRIEERDEAYPSDAGAAEG
jgi:hypothetical protein